MTRTGLSDHQICSLLDFAKTTPKYRDQILDELIQYFKGEDNTAKLKEDMASICLAEIRSIIERYEKE